MPTSTALQNVFRIHPPRALPIHHTFHQQLSAFNRQRLRPGFITEAWKEDLVTEARFKAIEARFVEAQRNRIADEAAAVPTQVDAFMAWFEELAVSGPGQGDPLFTWLATEASHAQMHWFLTQEIAGEAGFDDLVAMTQVKFPVQAKLELARNYWDEMGRGAEQGMHGLMLDRVAEEMNIHASPETTVEEALALANLMVAFAANRRYAYQSVGALGAVEMTAPGRVSQINEGLKRLNVPLAARRYFQLHAGLDIKHSEAWNREILRPLVAANPATAQPIAEGALLRLRAGAQCFERYRRELGVI